FVTPTPESVTKAGEGVLARTPDDLRVTLAGAEGEGAYPLAGFSYVLLYEEQEDAARGRALVDALSWAIHDGQRFTEPLHYARLPAALVPRVEAKLARVRWPSAAKP